MVNYLEEKNLHRSKQFIRGLFFACVTAVAAADLRQNSSKHNKCTKSLLARSSYVLLVFF